MADEQEVAVGRPREDADSARALVERLHGYPGDRMASPNWPKVAPGTWGVGNAISPLYCNLSVFSEINPKSPVLWIHGACDLIVSDASPIDDGRLGRRSKRLDWPGEEVYPPQPMVSQMYAVPDSYERLDGKYQEVVFDCGHTPHVEAPEPFQDVLFKFVDCLH